MKKKKEISAQRESNYDLLRIVSAIAVIMIHVSATYKKAITSDSFLGELHCDYTMGTLLYNMLPRFAVPCFIMLSGAFLLADDRNSDCRYFYKKSMKSVGIPTIIFSFFYFLYAIRWKCIDIVFKGAPLSVLINPIKSVIIGAPYYHMWYLYTLIGVYLLVPVIIHVKKSVDETFFYRASIIILIIASISGWTSTFKLHWSIAKVVCYIGYLLIGYHLRRCNTNRKNNGTGILLIVLGIMLEIVLTYIQYEHSLRGMTETEGVYGIISDFNPLTVVASLLIFAGFSKINMNVYLANLSAQTFYIYIWHAFVWDLLENIVKKIGVIGDSRIYIPLFTIVVFILSYLLSIIYTKMWNYIDAKCSISERVCKLLRL